MFKKISGKIWKKLTPAARLKIVRLTQRKFTVSAAAIITNEKNEVLLLDHVLRPFSNWGIPGGFLEAGEQPEQAVRREILEETGLQLENIKLLQARTNNRHVEIVFRAFASGKAEAKSREINAAVWFNVDEMPEEMNQKQKSYIQNLLESEQNQIF
ncbi:MAG: NUDIX hydrolase [Acidobacteriota bacterium]|nr:NUDIX hydrolase [Acidobacteriota bacterium]